MKTLIKYILEQITNHDLNKCNHSLVDGLSGISLFLHEYGNAYNDKKIIDLADELTEKIWDNLMGTMRGDSSNFYYGSSGILWAFEYLEMREFISLDSKSKEYLFLMNDNKYILERFSTPILIDIRCGLFAHGVYFLKRKYNSSYEQSLNLERLILLINECEFILYRQDLYNILKPNSFSLLNSILFFLLKCKLLSIYPSKVDHLLNSLLEQVRQITNNKHNVVDFCTFNCLIRSFPDEGNKITYEVNNHNGTTPLTSKNILDILTKAALYSLIYENKDIFSLTYSTLKCSEKIIKDSIAPINASLSINGLSGIGLGLLYLTNK